MQLVKSKQTSAPIGQNSTSSLILQNPLFLSIKQALDLIKDGAKVYYPICNNLLLLGTFVERANWFFIV